MYKHAAGMHPTEFMHFFEEEMVGVTGIEPVTPTMST